MRKKSLSLNKRRLQFEEGNYFSGEILAIMEKDRYKKQALIIDKKFEKAMGRLDTLFF